MNERYLFYGLLIVLAGGIVMIHTESWETLLGLLVIIIGGALAINGLMDGENYEDCEKEIKE